VLRIEGTTTSVNNIGPRDRDAVEAEKVSQLSDMLSPIHGHAFFSGNGGLGPIGGVTNENKETRGAVS
jgi:hypothetical protein